MGARLGGSWEDRTEEETFFLRGEEEFITLKRQRRFQAAEGVKIHRQE